MEWQIRETRETQSWRNIHQVYDKEWGQEEGTEGYRHLGEGRVYISAENLDQVYERD